MGRGSRCPCRPSGFGRGGAGWSRCSRLNARRSRPHLAVRRTVPGSQCAREPRGARRPTTVVVGAGRHRPTQPRLPPSFGRLDARRPSTSKVSPRGCRRTCLRDSAPVHQNQARLGRESASDTDQLRRRASTPTRASSSVPAEGASSSTASPRSSWTMTWAGALSARLHRRHRVRPSKLECTALTSEALGVTVSPRSKSRGRGTRRASGGVYL